MPKSMGADQETRKCYNETINNLRQPEYPMIKDSVYLDHAGSTLPSKSLMDGFAAELTSTLYGNPHSGSWSSQLASNRIADIRLRLLGFFKADPADYDLIFVANTTAAIKLVVDGFRSYPQGFSYAHHQACHTSLVGVREEATQSLCLDDDGVYRWLDGQDPFEEFSDNVPVTLFSYSAQSHLDGKRYPLNWSHRLKERYQSSSRQIFTLLDVASYSATSQLNLQDENFAADFVTLSLYKIFGFPDLGALLVRRSAESIFDQRKYFGGGTVDMVVCGKEKWHARKSHFLHERLEDGTLPFHSVMAVDMAIGVHRRLFGSMEQISLHTSYLTEKLCNGLRTLRHENGQPVCVVYTTSSAEHGLLGTGPVVAFNIKNSSGAWVGLAEFEKLALLKNIHIRTGALCSPGGIASILDLEPWDMRRNFSAGLRCGTESDIMSGKPAGVIRASIGAMSTAEDIHRLLEFMKEFFMEQSVPLVESNTNVAPAQPHVPALRVKTITVYPIKSCGGFVIPANKQWDLRPEGLAWDREWCLIHPGSGQALSQKRYPQMTLLQPSLDLENNFLYVEYRGVMPNSPTAKVAIPLVVDPSMFQLEHRQTASRVCGESISARIYKSDDINIFFSNALGIPCVLARFPPGGLGLSSRSSKARVQKHQQRDSMWRLPGSFPDIPSPPDSDSEQSKQGRILLSNESPMLMIHSSSVKALNQDILSRGGEAVPEDTFRANVVLEGSHGDDDLPAYLEDTWKTLRIGNEDFRLLGACRRCQMVCVDQETGERRQEPFSTLAKTRRFDGKVYFGVHMRHNPKSTGVDDPPRTIQVGDQVLVDTQLENS